MVARYLMCLVFCSQVALAESGNSYIGEVHVDCLDLNSVFAKRIDEDGHPVLVCMFTQLIAWGYDRPTVAQPMRLRVVDWLQLNEGDQPLINYRGGCYSFVCVTTGGRIVLVVANRFTATSTDHDPDIDDREKYGPQKGIWR